MKEARAFVSNEGQRTGTRPSAEAMVMSDRREIAASLAVSEHAATELYPAILACSSDSSAEPAAFAACQSALIA